ncbi:MAG: WYL domain-containing protein [Acidobacteria bacterium]|nr:WYL domain-containing protein [Acidobacteriota bacterium]
MRFNLIYAAHKLLKTSRYPVTMKIFQEELGRACQKDEVSRDTVERVVKDLQNFQAPLTNEKRPGYPGGWYYTDESYELPGLWFSADQLAGLLITEQALEQMQAGFLADYLKEFKSMIKLLLGKSGSDLGDFEGRIKLLRHAQRQNQYEHFPMVGLALLRNQKLAITYYTRGRDKREDRNISPQRLILYRDNWYLDAYCHNRKALRQFSVDCIEQAKIINETAYLLEKDELNKFINETYGIFYKELTDWAVLRFSATQARWIKNEVWHPKQIGEFLPCGKYELRVPFGESTELIRDILKYGAEVEVVEPEKLRQEMVKILEKTLEKYKND